MFDGSGAVVTIHRREVKSVGRADGGLWGDAGRITLKRMYLIAN